MSQIILQHLWQATWLSSAVIVLVLLLRAPMRHAFGSRRVYLMWLLVPLTLIAGFLPAPSQQTIAVAWPNDLIAMPSNIMALAPETASPVWPWALLTVWLLGCLGFAAWMLRQQQRFKQSMGLLTHTQHPSPCPVLRAEHNQGLPALVGSWQPIIVLPSDFDTRYNRTQQQLMLQHETQHWRQKDHWVNALVATFRALFWFNPLVHWAMNRLRHDQELACDEAILNAHPKHRQSYGEAMLNTALTQQPVPLGCHWGQLTHPLKERIMQLAKPPLSQRKKALGTTLTTAIIALTAFSAWATQGSTPSQNQTSIAIKAHAFQMSAEQKNADVAVRFSISMDDAAPRDTVVFSHFDKPFSLKEKASDGSTFNIDGRFYAEGDKQIRLKSTITRDGTLLSEPELIFNKHGTAAIHIGEEATDGTFKGIKLTLTSMDAKNMPPIPPPPPAPPKPPAVSSGK